MSLCKLSGRAGSRAVHVVSLWDMCQMTCQGEAPQGPAPDGLPGTCCLASGVAASQPSQRGACSSLTIHSVLNAHLDILFCEVFQNALTFSVGSVCLCTSSQVPSQMTYCELSADFVFLCPVLLSRRTMHVVISACCGYHFHNHFCLSQFQNWGVCVCVCCGVCSAVCGVCVSVCVVLCVPQCGNPTERVSMPLSLPSRGDASVPSCI